MATHATNTVNVQNYLLFPMEIVAVGMEKEHSDTLAQLCGTSA